MDLQFKRLTTTGSVTVSSTANTITFDSVAELNTGSSLPGDENVFAQKVGTDLQFKSLTAGPNVSLGSDANTITISATVTVPAFNTPVAIIGTATGVTNVSELLFQDSGAGDQATLGFSSSTNSDLTLTNSNANSNIIIAPGTTSGSVILRDRTVDRFQTFLQGASAVNRFRAIGDDNDSTVTTTAFDFLNETGGTQIGYMGFFDDTSVFGTAQSNLWITSSQGEVLLTRGFNANDIKLQTESTGIKVSGGTVNVAGTTTTASTNAPNITLGFSSGTTTHGYLGYLNGDGLSRCYVASPVAGGSVALSGGGSDIEANVKLETESFGVRVRGSSLVVHGNGDDPFSMTAILTYQTASNSSNFAKVGYADADGNFIVRNDIAARNTEIDASSGAVELHWSSNKKLETTSTGIAVTGDITATGTISDRRIKKDLTPINDCLERLSNVKAYHFKRVDNDSQQDGFILQELEETIPSAVIEGPEINGANKYPNYNAIIGHLIGAINELKQEIDLLKAA